MIAASLRDARASLLADTTRRGAAFGEALADVLDRTLRELFEDVGGKTRVALVALGSYARRELCPGSDVDVLLLHDAKGRGLPAVRDLAERIWYPLWDAGFVTGHGTRTVKDSIALADEDIDALTAFLDAHHIAGAEDLTDELVTRGPPTRAAPGPAGAHAVGRSVGLAARPPRARGRDAGARPQGRRRRPA